MIKSVKDIRPTHNNICVADFNPESESPIYIPGTAADPSQLYEVLAVGPGILLPNGTRSKPQVHPGDIVAFGNIQGHNIYAGGTCYHVASEEHIIAIVGTISTMKRREEPSRVATVGSSEVQ